MTVTRRIHLNPQSKGSLGKSFEAEFRIAWLDWHGIPWTGSDLDDRHHTFADRHPNLVNSYRLGHDDDSKATLLGLFRGIALLQEPFTPASTSGLKPTALSSTRWKNCNFWNPWLLRVCGSPSSSFPARTPKA